MPSPRSQASTKILKLKAPHLFHSKPSRRSRKFPHIAHRRSPLAVLMDTTDNSLSSYDDTNESVIHEARSYASNSLTSEEPTHNSLFNNLEPGDWTPTEAGSLNDSEINIPLSDGALGSRSMSLTGVYGVPTDRTNQQSMSNSVGSVVSSTAPQPPTDPGPSTSTTTSDKSSAAPSSPVPHELNSHILAGVNAAMLDGRVNSRRPKPPPSSHPIPPSADTTQNRSPSGSAKGSGAENRSASRSSSRNSRARSNSGSRRSEVPGSPSGLPFGRRISLASNISVPSFNPDNMSQSSEPRRVNIDLRELVVLNATLQNDADHLKNALEEEKARSAKAESKAEAALQEEKVNAKAMLIEEKARAAKEADELKETLREEKARAAKEADELKANLREEKANLREEKANLREEKARATKEADELKATLREEKARAAKEVDDLKARMNKEEVKAAKEVEALNRRLDKEEARTAKAEARVEALEARLMENN
ncbi:hypothetical protein DXG01_014234 [Tephrocybe rancida]|nr:hypothetical protein DXG01_014234 [Tephrocybe rancida]